MRITILIDKAFCYSVVIIYAAVAQERPPATNIFRAFHIDINNHAHRAVRRSLSDKLALRSGHKTVAPEQYAEIERRLEHHLRSGIERIGESVERLHQSPLLHLDVANPFISGLDPPLFADAGAHLLLAQTCRQFGLARTDTYPVDCTVSLCRWAVGFVLRLGYHQQYVGIARDHNVGIGLDAAIGIGGARLHECKARGRFRRDGIAPMVGDRVEFTPQIAGAKESYGYLEEIEPRGTFLVRPPLANVGKIIVVIAAASPAPDLLLLDKLLVNSAEQGIEAGVCVNKVDLAPAEDIAREYELAGYAVYPVSAVTGEGLGELRAGIGGRIAALAGQSGVGKSSLINALEPDMHLKIGDVSRIERGRHTTRHCELLLLPGGGLLADTPGFSLLEGDVADPLLLKDFYPEFDAYLGECRFDGCTHRSEPGCAVAEAAARGEISQGRLRRYAELFAERKERWLRRYD